MLTISRQKTIFRNMFALSVSLGALCVAAPSYAQEAKDDEDANREIVVTAQFREQKLQDTPLSITAVDSALLESRNQTDLAADRGQAPNVTLNSMGGAYGSSLGASIRGIGQFDFNPAYEPGVGMYIDDVYYPTLTGANFDLLDLERVEVLRGPQGTLTGRNSIGGAIKLISKDPSADTAGTVEATYGSAIVWTSAAARISLLPTDCMLAFLRCIRNRTAMSANMILAASIRAILWDCRRATAAQNCACRPLR